MEEQLKIYLEDNSWRGVAACRGVDFEEFRPPNAYGTGLRAENKEDYKARKAETIGKYCAKCEVKAPCLEYALATGEPGIYGGTDKDDRDRIIKERRREGE